MHVRYDMSFVVDGDNTNTLKSIIKNRNVWKYEVLSERAGYWHFWTPCKGLDAFAVKEKREDFRPYQEYDFFLQFGPSRYSGHHEANSTSRIVRDKEGAPVYQVTELDEEAVLKYVVGKELVFHVHYLEQFGNVEQTICRKFCNSILLLDQISDGTKLYDDFYDIRIFLKSMGKVIAPEKLEPIDVRDLDINKKILKILKRASKDYFFNPECDFYSEFGAVSKDLQAQYFVTCFHSNPAWDLNPICFFRFRISAFVLPGVVEVIPAGHLSKKSVVNNCTIPKKYVIDSIHFNTDICDDFEEFEKLMMLHYSEISLA